jgi:anaerobic magnesium-protoporphyrin IX monomethyl ester cyclase
MGSRDIRVLLLYPPNQNLPGMASKPNGSLAYPSLGGALRRHGVDVQVFDACVGGDSDPLDEVFYNSPTPLPSGMLRTGVTDERILQEAANYDIVGITSIFTEQETMVLHCARIIKAAFPDKILVSGGVNARARMSHFFAAGFDVVCLSESEDTITKIVDVARQSSAKPDFSGITGIAWPDSGRIRVNPSSSQDIVWDLDELPLPAWDLLPNKRYWEIGRPHGGIFTPGTEFRYASMMTSLGCPFHCSYCHIAGEQEGSIAGPIGKYRIKSDERVLQELDVLKDLGVKQVYIQDDSLMAQRKRALRLLEKIQGRGFDILDVNGINVIHLLKKWQPDHEVLQALVQAGFTQVGLPFESGNLRILRKYASNKLNIEKSNIEGLIKACKSYGLQIIGHYMIGYPDETREEIMTTIDLARKHMSYGLDAAHFFCVMPLPGTPLFEMAVAGGHVPRDFDPDRLNFLHANMSNTVVPAAELTELRDRAWEEMNSAAFKNYKKSMKVKVTTSAA